MAAALPILLFTLFILLNVAIWWAGPWLEIRGTKPLETLMARGTASALFVLLSLSGWGIWQWRKLQGFKSQQKREEQLKLDPITVYEERQEAELNDVMQEMKQSLNTRNYLYSLPWYLVLGLENAGKTSLINRSGQNFALSSVMRASGQKSENPYSFDWWIGDESVLIDPDGELLTQGNRNEDNDGELERRLWLNFVNWLEKTRSRRPLNGIVLALDVSHLATSTASERKAYANLLRARIRELMETLATRLPVYITLTKLDLLYGFEPFFKHYSKSQRDEVLGFTFSLESVDNLDHWLEEFSKDYGQFVSKINELFPHAVAEPLEQEERDAVYSFTRQMSGLQDILKEFFQDALSSDQFSTSALVRGAYFTSVYQQGVPSNVFGDSASRRYGLTHAVNKAQNAKNSTVYFTQQLFSNIIYPEAGLASDNFRVAKHKRRLMGLSFTACMVATVLLVGTWHRYYLANVNQSDAVLAKVNEYKAQYPSNLSLASQKDILEPLNKIRQATLEFGFFREKPRYISDFGLYQGHTIGPMVEDTYLNLLENRFLPLLMADVVVALEQADNEEEKLAVLRVYRMMVDKSGRYKDYVLDYFGKYWQSAFAGQKQVQGELLDHLDYAMRHTDLAGAREQGDEFAERVMKPYDRTIANVQAELSTMPNDQRVYRNLKLNAQTVLGPAISIRNLVGPIFDIVFEERVANSSLYIPQMLTKEGFESYFMPRSESVSELALIDSWVLGQSKTAQFSEADKQVLREKIRNLYVADYVNTWRAALNDIDMKYFGDINDAVMVLENLTGNVEPMQRLLRTLENNTQVIAGLDPDSDAGEELLKSAKYKVASSIQSPFAELNLMLKPVGDQPAYINEVLASVDELKTYLKAIQESPDVGMAALDATKARVKLVSADPIYTLKRISSGLPRPLDSMVAKLADESWYVVKQEAIKHLEVRWYEDVYKPYYTKLASRYPFNTQSKKDVALEDFESFFAPKGTLDNFYNNQLKVFIEENIAVDEYDTAQSIIRPEVLAQIEQAQRIRQAFFNRKGILDVNFSVEPLQLSGNKRRSVLNVDGQYLTYSHGPREGVELIWPNTLRDSAVSKVTLVPTKSNLSPRSINIKGPWAFFRLLEEGNVMSASKTSVDYRFAVDGGDMIYRINAESDANPFTERLFKSFKLSKTLY
ncbi:type VI secretion system membrane subunit TssM [Vibrio europaeus]|uniref:Type VI secretion system membrane subunit TssM n=1 Tax=Vibrio europaeus TaxID=300876 RepID=A0ABT5H090_9VIBR|nr:type VI secretion system membrane subunit TssM [Vibrio europaeus]MDC5703681.1 type VI secretion system membrane subunit TssM [Vibrio europaeus]MDC5708365.1 type VI secretion system membrane subunit TssM [Vibrio europaeus]MDC5714228.1 type VI secretion system membrane subunit TssM [Vibrio europaeus]MDC5727276.1 type VI secretion system membrane subunit TssM [Vibrio europaeus]MDC5729947.1 type VI secretion system membrane subunit TssM [Vibrio europaeus]